MLLGSKATHLGARREDLVRGICRDRCHLAGQPKGEQSASATGTAAAWQPYCFQCGARLQLRRWPFSAYCINIKLLQPASTN